MVFNAKQKSEVENIVKEVSKDILNGLMSDKKFMDIFASRIAEIVAQKVSEQMTQLTERINSFEKQVNTIQGENEELRTRIDDLEQQFKLSQVRLYGVPESSDKDLKRKVQEIFESRIGVTDISIEHCYRVGSPTQRGSKPRAIIVKFINQLQRNMVYYNKKKLKGSKMVITDELTKNRYELLVLAKERLGKEKVWSSNGRVFSEVNNKKVLIKTEEDIVKLCN